MPEQLTLPEPWASQGWKAKIREREGPEEPHVTILHRTRAWRFSLRRWRCLDSDPPEREVPDGVIDYVRTKLPELVAAWDLKYPKNPVQTPEEPSKDRNEQPVANKKSKPRRR
jgi:hypothetical protein